MGILGNKNESPEQLIMNLFDSIEKRVNEYIVRYENGDPKLGLQPNRGTQKIIERACVDEYPVNDPVWFCVCRLYYNYNVSDSREAAKILKNIKKGEVGSYVDNATQMYLNCVRNLNMARNLSSNKNRYSRDFDQYEIAKETLLTTLQFREYLEGHAPRGKQYIRK